jgi:two-component system cell cycle sensor histidine kinase/response regulator CckA
MAKSPKRSGPSDPQNPQGPETAKSIYDTHHRLVIRNATAYAILTMDVDGVIRTWNNGAERTLGYTEGEIVGQHFSVLFTADDRASRVPEHQLELAMHAGHADDIRWHLRKDGTRFWANGFLIALKDESGHCVGVATILSDATERKELEDALRTSEGQYRRVIEQLPLSTQIVAPDGRLLQVNHASEALLGITVDELQARNMLEDEQLARTGVVPYIQRALAGEAASAPPVSYVPAHGRRAGETLWIETAAYPVKDELGQVSEVVVVQEDVTERKLEEEALRHTQKLESIGILASGIAHDFNNLLTGILGNAALALRARTLDNARPLLEEVMRAGQRAADLTRQLLAYAGKGQLYTRLVDLHQVIPEISSLLRASLPSKVDIEFQLEGERRINADPGQIQQLIMNLVLNAVESYGDETGTVVVRVHEEHMSRDRLRQHFATYELPAGEYLCLEVSDKGMGMDPETQRRLFDPFFTTKFMGRGLGLAAVLGIVRGHQGGLRVASALGEGSTFTVLFPLTDSVGSESAAATLEVSQPRGSGRVLVVDDEEVTRSVTKGMLEAYGYTVEVAANGREALERVRDGSGIDLVLTDIAMPIMDGAEAFRDLRRLRPNLAILVMTGLGELEAANRFKGTNVKAIIHKPFTPEELAQKVGEAIPSRRS